VAVAALHDQSLKKKDKKLMMHMITPQLFSFEQDWLMPMMRLQIWLKSCSIAPRL
jgi:hypothetical protein